MKTVLAARGLICVALLSPLSYAQESGSQPPLRGAYSAEHVPAGVQAPAFSVSTRKDSLGDVPVGGKKTDSVTVKNTGSPTLTISNVRSTSTEFTVGPISASLSPGSSRKFGITLSPTGAGAKTASIIFTHNGSTSPDTVKATGNGTVPAFSVDRKSVPFGIVALGSNRRDSIAVSDTGKAPLVITSVTSSNGTFTVSPQADTIQPSQTAKFYLTFTPVKATAQTGIVVFNHNAPNLHDTVGVSGTGKGAVFAVNRKVIAFGSVFLGTQGLDSVAVSDSGLTPLVISAVTSTNARFTVNPQNATIQPSGTAKFIITFTPQNTALQNGNIVFTHNAPSSPDTVGVSGIGGGRAAFSVTRRSVPFGIVALGSNRLDSVAVSDTGIAPLVITSVTSSNGKFSVSPPAATIQPSQTAKFYLTFTPVNATAQTGIVVFNHNAPNLHDTVGVSGTGKGAVFAVNRKVIAFGSVFPGTQGLDSVAVSDSGLTPLVISAVISTNGTFTVNPQNATIQPSGTAKFFITFTPQNTALQNGSIVFTHNAPSVHDTVAVSGTGRAALAPPVLAGPPGGSTGEPPTLTLTWNNVTGGTGYWVQMATDSQFTTLVISDSTLTDTSRQVSSLPYNTIYYWHVSTKNAVGFGNFSASWTLATLSTGMVAGTISFSGSVTSTAYRMFGLPGVGARKVGGIFTGTQKVDWRILGDDGSNATYPAYYFDLTADSILRAGEGYWLLQKTNLVIVRTDTLPPLSPDGTYGIPLHGGWNIISNPFTVTLLRSSIFASNGLPPTTVLWEHSGDTTTSSGTTFDPFKGYYFDNGAVNLPLLKIPYPIQGAGPAAGLAKHTVSGWRAELVFRSDINTDRDNYIGIDPSAGAGRNALDQHAPPLDFDQGFLYFVHPEWDGAHPRFATDIRGAIGDGQTWDFEVWNPRKGTGTITLLGAGEIPASSEVILVNEQNTPPVDMRRTNAYTFQTTAPTTQFRLIVGTKEYADGEIAKLIPQKFDLAQNYPNPFNPSTTIGYMLPAGSDVRLEILSVLGQRVRLLENGYRAAGTYAVTWDGKDDNALAVSSGIYFCRLVAGGNAIRTRKLVLVK